MQQYVENLVEGKNMFTLKTVGAAAAATTN